MQLHLTFHHMHSWKGSVYWICRKKVAILSVVLSIHHPHPHLFIYLFIYFCGGLVLGRGGALSPNSIHWSESRFLNV